MVKQELQAYDYQHKKWQGQRRENKTLAEYLLFYFPFDNGPGAIIN